MSPRARRCAHARRYRQIFTPEGVEHDVVPATLQPRSLQSFLSFAVSFPDGEGHILHELPAPQEKHMFFASDVVTWARTMSSAHDNTNVNDNSFFMKTSE
ncbi:MAG TPA: hypothetical protein PLE73_09580 [Spirochaetota bacterium]|nr:hypothetical protein [Spirochaetota bacterium]HPI23438.1 hypothetical protein [Spirochaetota bacterium]